MYRVFSDDVTTAILVSQNNETAAMLVSQISPVGVEFLFYANAFYLHRCWPREWKHSIYSMLWLVKIWQMSSCGKFMQHLETCFSIGEADSVVSSCDGFNWLFPLDVQNEIQLLPRIFCYSWLVCLLGFWLRNAPLVGNPISESIFCKSELNTHFTLLDA